MCRIKCDAGIKKVRSATPVQCPQVWEYLFSFSLQINLHWLSVEALPGIWMSGWGFILPSILFSTRCFLCAQQHLALPLSTCATVGAWGRDDSPPPSTPASSYMWTGQRWPHKRESGSRSEMLLGCSTMGGGPGCRPRGPPTPASCFLHGKTNGFQKPGKGTRKLSCCCFLQLLFQSVVPNCFTLTLLYLCVAIPPCQKQIFHFSQLKYLLEQEK